MSAVPLDKSEKFRKFIDDKITRTFTGQVCEQGIKICLCTRLSMNLYELFGVILGDGCITYRPDLRVYTLEIVGNATEETDYYQSIAVILERISGKTPRILIRHEKKGKSLRLYLHSKLFLQFLMKELRLDGKPKTNTVFIPQKFLSWRIAKHVIRGFFETDGSLYFTRVNNVPTYPRIEMKTKSPRLAYQLKEILSERGFIVHRRTCRPENVFGIYLSGKKMCEKWVREIGFSSMKNKTKYELWKRLGFYIPWSSLTYRRKCLRRWPSG